MSASKSWSFRVKEWMRPLIQRVRRLRRRLSQKLDPGPEPDDAFDWFIYEPLQCANALRAHMRLDEASYVGVAGQAHADARAYVVYTALDEVQKTSLWLIRMRELIQGDAVDPREGYVERLLHTHLIEERDARTRRLLETLVTLVLFGKTNEQPFYRHLLALEMLDEEISAQADATEFWGAPSNNLAWSIRHQMDLVRRCEEEVDLSRCWYLADRKALPDVARLAPGRLLSSMRSRIRAALPLMREREQLLLGFSYGASYGRTSESMHYSPDRRDFRIVADKDLTGRGHLGLLSFEILLRCQSLLGGPAVPALDKLGGLLSRRDKEAPASLSRFGACVVGDIVLANGELGQVFEVVESSYAYKSFRVRYLAERPIAGIDEDWFPALYVRRIYSQEQFFERMQEMIAEGTLPADLEQQMRKLNEEELQKILAASVTEVWKLGLRDVMRTPAQKRRGPAG